MTDMDDRTLLERAARAAGMTGWTYHDEDGGAMRSPPKESRYLRVYSYWSPLHDDGDALRLAMKLQINLLFQVNGIEARTYQGQFFIAREPVMYADAQAVQVATRRAIVRAAAQMGGEG